MVEPGDGDRQPLLVDPCDDVIPPKRPDLLGAKTDGQTHRDVGMHQRARANAWMCGRWNTTLLGGCEQRDSLVESQRPGPPARLSLRGVHQGRDVAADQVPGLGVADQPREAVVRNRHRRRAAGRGDRCQRPVHLGGRQFPQPLAPDDRHEPERTSAETGWLPLWLPLSLKILLTMALNWWAVQDLNL